MRYFDMLNVPAGLIEQNDGWQVDRTDEDQQASTTAICASRHRRLDEHLENVICKGRSV